MYDEELRIYSGREFHKNVERTNNVDLPTSNLGL